MGKAKNFTPPRPYRSDLMTRDAANLLAYLRIERADVMGYSMGARIASFLALEHPSLVRSLILGGLGDRLVRDGGLPEAIAEAMEAPSLGQPYRPDATSVSRLCRPDEKRPRRTCRLYSRRAPKPDAGRGGGHSPADLVAVGERDTLAGELRKLVALLPRAEALSNPRPRPQPCGRGQGVQGRSAPFSSSPGVSPAAQLHRLKS